MSRLLALIVASTFVFGSAAGFAADTAPKKKEDLTKEERAEMRSRADKLIAQRATQPAAQAKAVEKAPAKAKKQTHKQHKNAPHEAKPAQPRT